MAGVCVRVRGCVRECREWVVNFLPICPPPRTALDSLLMKLFRLCRIDKKLESFPGTKWRVEGVVWLLITLALAIFVPEISYVLNPIGGLAGTFIFVFPG